MPVPAWFDDGKIGIFIHPAETNNLSGKHPDKVKELTQLAEKYIADGRSTPGAKQQNNGSGTYLYPGWIRKAQAR